MSVKETVFQYTAKGASKAAREDRKVRESVKETGSTARQESGVVKRWQERHSRAIKGIAGAAAGAMGAILAASPTLRAELSGVRTAFSLFADQVVRDVLPGVGSLTGATMDLASGYRDLDDDLRETISGLLLVGGAAGVATLAFGPAAGAVALFAGGAALAIFKSDELRGALEEVGEIAGDELPEPLGSLAQFLIVDVAGGFFDAAEGAAIFGSIAVDAVRDFIDEARDAVPLLDSIAGAGGRLADEVREQDDRSFRDRVTETVIGSIIPGGDLFVRVGRERRRMREAAERAEETRQRRGDIDVGEAERRALHHLPGTRDEQRTDFTRPTGFDVTADTDIPRTERGDVHINIEQGAIELPQVEPEQFDMQQMVDGMFREIERQFGGQVQAP